MNCSQSIYCMRAGWTLVNSFPSSNRLQGIGHHPVGFGLLSLIRRPSLMSFHPVFLKLPSISMEQLDHRAVTRRWVAICSAFLFAWNQLVQSPKHFLTSERGLLVNRCSLWPLRQECCRWRRLGRSLLYNPSFCSYSIMNQFWNLSLAIYISQIFGRLVVKRKGEKYSRVMPTSTVMVSQLKG